MYKIIVRGKAKKQLFQISPPHFQRIKDQIDKLGKNPRLIGSKKLKGENGYRVRVGNYRLLYEIDDEARLITIYRVKHRRDVYK